MHRDRCVEHGGDLRAALGGRGRGLPLRRALGDRTTLRDARPDGPEEQRDEGDEGEEHEDRAQDARAGGHGEQAQHEPAVDDDEAQDPPPVHLAHASTHDRRTAPDDRRHEVAQRAEQHLEHEADDEDRRDGVVPGGGIGPGGCGGHPPRDGEDPGDEPEQPGGHGCRGVVARRPSTGRASHRGRRPGEAGEVDEQPDRDERPAADERGGDGEGQPADEDRQGGACPPLGVGVHRGAQHRRPQRDDGRDDRDPQPAEDVDEGVRDDEARVHLVVRPAGEQGAQERADRQAGRGDEVRAHGDPEAARQCVAQPSPQGDRVPGHRRDDEGGADDRRGPQGARHADEHEDGPGVQQEQPPPLRRPGVEIGRGLEQGRREVGAPHHDRVAHRAERDHVHHEPRRPRDEGVDERRRRGEDEPDEPGPVAQAPRATCRAAGGARRRRGAGRRAPGGAHRWAR